MSARTPPVNVFTTLSLALLHLRKIDMHAIDHDAVFHSFLFCEHEMIARRQQRFARDAANVQTSAAKLFVIFRRAPSSVRAGRRGSRRYSPPGPEPIITTSNFSMTSSSARRARHASLQKSSGSFFGSSMHSFTFDEKRDRLLFHRSRDDRS